jgi:L-ascorbate metabolism protein UlaG (beta-lactamase superfamily)
MHPFDTLTVPSDHLAVQWLGQSSFALKSPGGAVVLIDPYFPHERPAEKFEHAEPPLNEADLAVDGVLLTHDHSDHTHDETIARICDTSPDAIYAGPHESAERAKGAGVAAEKFSVVDAGDCAAIEDITAHFVFAKPPEGDPARDIDPPDVTHLGMVVVAGAVRVYFSGDPINTFGELPAMTEPVRALAPSVGWLTNHPTEGEFPYFDGCVLMAARVGLDAVYPSHCQCFAKRTYDTGHWAAQFAGVGPTPRIMGYGQTVIVS